MKISVVIPAHNRPDFLKEAAESIAAQTYTDWEAVIVDDGSTPAIVTDSLLALLGGKAIFLRHDNALGIARAKNAGIRAATGEIITLLDDDDLLAPSALEGIHTAFTSLPDLDCLFLGVEPFGPYAAGPASNRKKAIDRIIQHAIQSEHNGLHLFDDRLFQELLHSVPIDFQRPAARKGAWNIVGGYDESGLFSESAWAIKASTVCKVALTKDPLTSWRIHDNNFGWPSGQSKDQAELRQLGNSLVSAQSLAHHYRRKHVETGIQRKLVVAHLADVYFTKAYFLRDKNKLMGLCALFRSMALSVQPKQFRLFLKYLLPTIKNKPDSAV